MSVRYADLTGQIFGHLKVTGLAFSAHGMRYWRVLCECGNTTVKRGSRLAQKTGSSVYCSCACPLHRKHLAARLSTHGLTNHSIYSVWNSMKNRCGNPNTINYHNYGGRGIAVCPRWANSFTAFLEDVGKSWQQGLQLDRIDNDGDYEPANVRWVTPKANGANKRNSVLTEDQIASAKANGVCLATVHSRLKYGWPIMDAITKPTQHSKATQ